MPTFRTLRAAVVAPVLAAASMTPVLAGVASAAAAPTTLAEVASHLENTEVDVVPGYDGPAIDAATITAEIDEQINGDHKAAIRVVALPYSIASHYAIGALPGLLKKESGFGGDVAVLTKVGFRATDADDATEAFDESKSKGATAVVDDWVDRVQIRDGLADGSIANPANSIGEPSGPGSGGGVVVLFVFLGLAAVAIGAVVPNTRRRGLVGGADPRLQHYGSVAGSNLTDLLILETLFHPGYVGGGFGGGGFGGGGFGSGPFGGGFGNGPGNGDPDGMPAAGTGPAARAAAAAGVGVPAAATGDARHPTDPPVRSRQ